MNTSNSAKTVLYQDFEIERNAKNQAYAFIIASGNFRDFSEFCKQTKDIGDYHGLCLELLADLIKEE